MRSTHKLTVTSSPSLSVSFCFAFTLLSSLFTPSHLSVQLEDEQEERSLFEVYICDASFTSLISHTLDLFVSHLLIGSPLEYESRWLILIHYDPLSLSFSTFFLLLLEVHCVSMSHKGRPSGNKVTFLAPSNCHLCSSGSKISKLSCCRSLTFFFSCRFSFSVTDRPGESEWNSGKWKNESEKRKRSNAEDAKWSIHCDQLRRCAHSCVLQSLLSFSWHQFSLGWVYKQKPYLLLHA